jgi:hypothetical protein
MALLHGRVAEAAGWNPLVFTAVVAIALVNLYAAAVLAGRLPRLRFSLGAAEARLVRVAGVLSVAANWAYVIHRAA